MRQVARVLCGIATALGLLCSYAQTPAISGTGADALAAFNAYRQPMGLSHLTWHPALADTARGHSHYLSALQDRSILSKLAPDGTPEMHRQRAGGAHFTGVTVGDRAKRQGYAFAAGEQVVFSSGGNQGSDVIDQLMATVYHRSGLLNPAWAEFGGAVDSPDAVIVMGEGAAKRQVAPDWLATYPSPQTRVRRIAFQNEIPDPAPDRPGQWLGLPISIHAAPGRTLRTSRFELREIGTSAPVSAKILQAENDVRIARSEVFLMPDKPLRYAAEYEVAATVGIVGVSEVRNLRWIFQTPPNPFAVKPTAAITEVTPGIAQRIELTGAQGSWSWDTRTSMPQGVRIETRDLGNGAMNIVFPSTCNADCRVVVTVKHEGPHPSTERREFVVAKAWLASRSVDEVIPASFVDAAKNLQKQAAPYAMAYGKVGQQWFLSTTSAAANQSSANQSALEGCTKQIAALSGNSNTASCQLYPFK